MPHDAPLTFFEHPILNSPYAYPGRHWELELVQRVHAELGCSVALVGGLLPPGDGLGLVFGHSDAVGQHPSELELGDGVAAGSSLAEKFGAHRIVLLDTPSVGVHLTQTTLGGHITAVSSSWGQ